LGAAATDLGLAITRATNTQNRINRQDFVALDPQQERLRAELAVEGIAYHYKSGEAVVRNETTFDLEEATVALACAHPDLAFSTQAKREIGRLWEDTSRAPYKALFNGSTSSAALWRDVRLLRAVEGTLQAKQQTLEGRDKGFAVHGNRFVAHNVFRLLDGIGSSDAVAEVRMPAAVEAVLEATMKAANDAFPGAYLAQLFKNQNKLTQLESSLPRWMVTA
jgi:hypothetical protein